MDLQHDQSFERFVTWRRVLTAMSGRRKEERSLIKDLKRHARLAVASRIYAREHEEEERSLITDLERLQRKRS